MKKSIPGLAAAALVCLSAGAQQSAPAPTPADPVPAPPFNTMYGDVAKVVSTKPVPESMAFPRRECRVEGGSSDAAPEVQRCEPAAAGTERIVAYDVTYEYNGRQFNIRMPYDPGEQMPVNVHVVPPSPRPPMNRPNGQGPMNPRYRGT
jgi:uncharacterized protein YcfJ